tara:strand:- start:489 stop:1049 length:561 start_codon:yes stop_codon:yes gene_type:complete
MGRDIKFLVDDMKDATIAAARAATVQTMNSLAQNGPAWTGAFSSAWYAVPSGKKPGGPRAIGGIYNYTLRNIPKTRFKTGENSIRLYEIVNGMSYASIALDLDPFIYASKGFNYGDPIKPVVNSGLRKEGGKRGEITSSKGNNNSTAPFNWYRTYAGGGGLKKDFKIGANLGFGKFKPVRISRSSI